LVGRLLLTELRAALRPFLVVVPAAVITVLVMGPAMGALAGEVIVPLSLAMATWGYQMRVVFEDDRAGTWRFVRPLPIPPRSIVAVRFLSGLVAVGAYTALLCLAAVLLPLITARVAPPASWGVVILRSLALGCLLLAAFNAIYFRLGSRAMGSAMSYILVLVFLPGLVLTTPLKGSGPATELAQWLSQATAWAAKERGLALLLGASIVTGVFAGAWAYAASAFARKEVP